jgi:hypothetical protein
LGYPYPEYTTANTWSQTPKFVCEKLPENARLRRRQPKRAGENQILLENHPTATNRAAGDNQNLAGDNQILPKNKNHPTATNRPADDNQTLARTPKPCRKTPNYFLWPPQRVSITTNSTYRRRQPTINDDLRPTSHEYTTNPTMEMTAQSHHWRC